MKNKIIIELESLGALHLIASKQQKKESFLVPKNYFEVKKKSLIHLSGSKSRYKVPENYFATFNEELMESIDKLEEQKKFKKAPLISNVSTYFGVAASIALLLGMFYILKPANDGFTSEEIDFLSSQLDDAEMAFINNSAETYVLNTIYEDFGLVQDEGNELLNPLFEDFDNLDEFDSLLIIS